MPVYILKDIERKYKMESIESFSNAWELICNYCKSQITNIAFETWFTNLKPLSLDFEEGVATLEAPNNFHKQTIERVYTNLLNEAFEEVFGGMISFRICIHEEIVEEENKKKKAASEHYDLTFDTFIVGSSNKFAHAACIAVAERPAEVYNPLFIYGNSGLGKTHLLNAIAAEIERKYPHKVIVYVKGDEFTNELIEAIGRGTTLAFKEKYRKADILLMDDIQFIAGRESTQEEFFHTFNTLYESRKQIILTSDRPAKDIATLEDRLKTRFQQGLTADIQPPDYETRIAIIKRKASILEMELPDIVCEYIANKIKSNIRQLEGVVKKMKAYQLLDNKNPGIATAQNAISDIFSDEEPTPVTVEKIIDYVAKSYSCTKEDILSPNQSAKISKCRQICCYIIREVTQITVKEIGEILGRDHSTVVYAIHKIEQKIKKDPSLKASVSDIIKNVKVR